MAGLGGDGIVSAGESLLTAAALEGYHGVLTKSFGPQIRGGEFQVSGLRCARTRCSIPAGRSTWPSR